MVFTQCKVMGIIGDGIKHTLSPTLHHYAAKKLAIDCNYGIFEMRVDEIEAFLGDMWDQGALGFNVTMPHKMAVAKILQHRGGKNLPTAVNTLYRGDCWWEGYSTDGAGFVNGLSSIGIKAGDFQQVIFLGAGGAAAALVEHWRRSEWADATLTVLARNPEKVQIMNCRVVHLTPEALKVELLNASEKTLLVQATSAPLQGDDLRSFIPAVAEFSGVFVDLTYGTTSALVPYLKNRGLVVQDGLPMLIEQARLSQNLWWGKNVKARDLYLAVAKEGE